MCVCVCVCVGVKRKLGKKEKEDMETFIFVRMCTYVDQKVRSLIRLYKIDIDL